MSGKRHVSESIAKSLYYRRTTGFYKLVKMAAILSPFLFPTAHVQAQSAIDGFDPNANDVIWVVVVQPDGKILLGGDFTTLAPKGGVPVPRNRIARLNPDGMLDPDFDPDADDTIECIALQADGKILVGGWFTTMGGQTRKGLARLDATTGMPDSFDPNATGMRVIVTSIAVQADGNILAGGFFSTIGGQIRNGIARLIATTALADSFNPHADGPVYSIVVQADGNILAGGGFTNIGGQARYGLARLDPQTGLADSFNPNRFGGGRVRSIAVQADGKILAGGDFTGEIGGQVRNGIARLDANTGLADSFNPADPYQYPQSIQSIVVQPDGKILVAGVFDRIGGETRRGFARLDPTGLADSFDPNFQNSSNAVEAVAVQPDGKIVVGGQFRNAGKQIRNRVARVEVDGRVDQTLDPNIAGSVLTTAVQPDGKLLIGGAFNSVLGAARGNIARLNTDGTLDTAFDPNANNAVNSIAIQADGKILVGGSFNIIGKETRTCIARLEATTGLADSFDPNAIKPVGFVAVSAIAVQADGKILTSGNFSGIGGQPRNLIARLDPTTGLADSFDPGPNSFVYSIAVQSNGKILVGGAFNQIGQSLRNRIARLDPTTGVADAFDPNANGFIYSIAVQADGQILVGGDFSGVNSIGGKTRKYIARLNATNGKADSFDPSANDVVWTIAPQADGKILAGGDFSFIGGQTRNHIARLDSTTGAADSFDPNTNDKVHSIALQGDGKVLVGGLFTSISGQPRNRFARLSNDTAALGDLAVTQNAITWLLGGSIPQFGRVTFERSTDNVNYIPLGNGIPRGSNWSLTGLSLMTGHFQIRARGYYRSGSQSSSESITESVRNVFLTPTKLANISTRLRAGTGDNAVIGGFIITGTQPKTVIVRGIGPSLPLPGALADPVIEVHGSSGEVVATNDNWLDADSRGAIIESGLAPTNHLESALWGILNPGAYTVVVRGNNNGTGVGLFEVYDLDQPADSKLANISTRGLVETSDNVMIGGTIIVGNDPARVLLRAIGPSLTGSGLTNALQDPMLELHDGNGALIASNDNWRSDQEAEIIATGIPPSNDLESAILRELAPGNYNAIVHGVNNTIGVALVEAYGLN